MAFPALNGPTFPLGVEEAWNRARSSAQSVKSQATTLLALIAAGPVSSRIILDAVSSFVSLNAQLTTCKDVPGIAAYAQEQVNNPALNVAAEFTTMQNALVSTLTWVSNNFPKDGQGNLLCLKIDGTGLVYLIFTQAQLAGFVTQLNALSATIA